MQNNGVISFEWNFITLEPLSQRKSQYFPARKEYEQGLLKYEN